MFVLAAALKSGNFTVDRLYELTKIDHWFLHKLQNIIDIQNQMETYTYAHDIERDVLLRSKQMGFSDKQIAMAIERLVINKLVNKFIVSFSLLTFLCSRIN